LPTGVSYRAKHIVLVQPRGEKSLRETVVPAGELGGIKLWLFVFDMKADSLESEEARSADLIFGLERLHS
jgi:hypothetical protein